MVTAAMVDAAAAARVFLITVYKQCIIHVSWSDKSTERVELRIHETETWIDTCRLQQAFSAKDAGKAKGYAC